jgi:DNA-directed RNA polymerase specialized sigma24 family protein
MPTYEKILATNKRGQAIREASRERRQEALRLSNSGLSYREVGLIIGAQKSHAWQLVRRARLERLYYALGVGNE